VRETKDYLGSAAATLTIESARVRGAELDVEVQIESTTGHKLPTAYPARRAWVHLKVTDAGGTTLFESGAPRADGSIAGNDNDEDPLRFEPHHEQIDSANQVQVYESVMVDRDGRATTGLLRGVRYVKDNRLLPRGFDKARADADVAVQGEAATDDDFVGGGDRVSYRVSLAGSNAGDLQVEATLLYQSIGYRWAENLEAYDSPEPKRFARYYAESAAASAITLAAARTRVAGR
jgi:hypothetical protein